MHELLIAILIFLLRIGDVSIGTLRAIYTIRGQRLLSMGLGVVESAIWLIAITKAVDLVKHNRWAMVGWACGFGAGTFAGITIEKWIASGHVLMRVISPSHCHELRDALLQQEIGVTALPGQGRDGEVQILFVVAPRRRGDALLATVRRIDPDAFITIDPITTAIGGYMPLHVRPSSIRK